MKPNSICLTILSLTLSLLSAHGQGYSQPTRMTSPSGSARASLSQDVALLKEQLGEMRFEVERLLRENETLELRMKKLEAQGAAAVSDVVFRQELASLKAEFNRLSKAQREELAKQITKQIKGLADQVNQGGASSRGSSSAAPPVITEWDPNSFPKTGIYYKVQSGDTLSKIASEVGSKISYITHANKIPNPDRLQVGRELFIPIDNQ
ncbi:LysM peptidoglycan-binding domain-containing protein [Opitutia bacterium ISCC 51]|nr:LysM peptidoglycan-binding domain-containing protein [Opitutae bacterium ISCC 51]QXD28865.1 LysM peptidoglycan-binding domain-containing protein [Opitutae bacterium ISCC 52]